MLRIRKSKIEKKPSLDTEEVKNMLNKEDITQSAQDMLDKRKQNNSRTRGAKTNFGISSNSNSNMDSL